jgi:hypothetical protein
MVLELLVITPVVSMRWHTVCFYSNPSFFNDDDEEEEDDDEEEEDDDDDDDEYGERQF